jgi:hypothetical protein
MLIRFSIISFFFLLPFVSEAQVKYSNEFLTLGIGARAHGQGTAIVARATDVTGGYWNPACLPLIKAPFQVSLMHAEWFAGVAKLDYMGFVKSLNTVKPSHLGVSLIRLGIDQIPNTLNLVEPDGTINFDNLSEFSAADYAFLFSYGRQISNQGPEKQFSLGSNFKLIRRQVGSFGNAWGFGLDAGLLLKKRRWNLGVVVRDASFTFNAWSFTLAEEEKETFRQTGNDIPENSLEITRPRLLLGFAWLPKTGNIWSLALETDLHLTTDGRRKTLISGNTFSIDPYLGTEVQYRDLLSLRGGLSNFQQISNDLDGSKELSFQPTFGIGLSLGRLTIDYAFTDLGNYSPVLYSHIFSLQIDFEEKDK